MTFDEIYRKTKQIQAKHYNNQKMFINGSYGFYDFESYFAGKVLKSKKFNLKL